MVGSFQRLSDGRLFAGDGRRIAKWWRVRRTASGSTYFGRSAFGCAGIKTADSANLIVQASLLGTPGEHGQARLPLDPIYFLARHKWIVFRSNMLGPTHVYAVEIAKSAGPRHSST